MIPTINIRQKDFPTVTLADVEPGGCFTVDGIVWSRGKTDDGTGSESLMADVTGAIQSIPGGPWIPIVCMHPWYFGQISVMQSEVPVHPIESATFDIVVSEPPKPLT